VGRGTLNYLRAHIVTHRPNRRFEIAMDKSVLILSDTQLVTGLAILISGYSQLNCGISAYHWQIMVFEAWFSSFTFISCMTFLVGYFETNSTMRIIRLCFMLILASLLIVALLPTGSVNWLDWTGVRGGFYPSIAALCFFNQLSEESYINGGPKVWSMIFSLLVVAFSYIHCGIRLFDPTSELTQRYLRVWPGRHFKHLLKYLEQQSRRNTLWATPYFVVFLSFTTMRALYDLAESMLIEIL
jgi:hypothetical protein